METNQQIAMRYFEAWKKRDWELMRSILSPKFFLDGGQIRLPSIDIFLSFCKEGPSWRDLNLLDIVATENKAALFYEGKTGNGEKIRVAEFLLIEQDKILSSQAVLSLG